MQRERDGRPSRIAVILALVGGGLMILGSLLSWAEVSGGGTRVVVEGTDGSDGWVTLVCGGLIVLVGALLVRSAGRRAIATLVLVLSVIGGGLGLYDALAAKDHVLNDAAEQLAARFGGTTEHVRSLLDAAIDAGEIGPSIDVGLYLVIVGGALGLAAGVLGLIRRAPTTVAASETPAPPVGAAPMPDLPPPPPPLPAAAAADAPASSRVEGEGEREHPEDGS